MKIHEIYHLNCQIYLKNIKLYLVDRLLCNLRVWLPVLSVLCVACS